MRACKGCLNGTHDFNHLNSCFSLVLVDAITSFCNCYIVIILLYLLYNLIKQPFLKKKYSQQSPKIDLALTLYNSLFEKLGNKWSGRNEYYYKFVVQMMAENQKLVIFILII